MNGFACLAVSTLITVFFCSCAAPRYEPEGGQAAVYTNGVAMVTSYSRNSGIAITPLGIDEGKARFAVTIANIGRSAMVVHPEQITASDGQGKKVRVFSARDLERAARRRAALLAMATAMNAAGQTMQATQPTTTYHSGYVGNGLSGVNYTGVSESYNPARSAAAVSKINADSRGQMSAIADNLSSQLDEVANVFDTTTIFPQSSHSALLVTKAPRVIHIRFSISGEIHEANFIMKK